MKHILVFRKGNNINHIIKNLLLFSFHYKFPPQPNGALSYAQTQVCSKTHYKSVTKTQFLRKCRKWKTYSRVFSCSIVLLSYAKFKSTSSIYSCTRITQKNKLFISLFCTNMFLAIKYPQMLLTINSKLSYWKQPSIKLRLKC